MLGHRGAEGPEAPNGASLVPDPPGSCSVVSEQVPPGVLHLLILNDDGVKARRTNSCLASTWHEA